MEDYKTSEEYNASSHGDETAPIHKKYGGLLPKKKPLISKDHERAFFDSADWALCKMLLDTVAAYITIYVQSTRLQRSYSIRFGHAQGAGVDQKSTVAIETLRPKLQRTPHQQLPPRRPACTS